MATELDPVISDFLRKSELIDFKSYDARPLTGGVASDIWLVKSDKGDVVVKKALEKLRVAQDWHAPVSRNASEVDWLVTAQKIVPTAVPRVLAHDSQSGVFAMTYLEPNLHPVWKSELLQGNVSRDFAETLGQTLGKIHASTAHREEVAEAFDNDSTFHSLRLEPYLEATAKIHTDLSDRLFDLSQTTASNKHALVHGDVSPKNILCSPTGPVILDAECAWYGDPSFDLAFCLNHLLLKALHVSGSRHALIDAFDACSAAYLDNVDWEKRGAFEARAAALLPALTLARVDGKSPVEYLTEDEPKDFIRRVTRGLLTYPVQTLNEVSEIWNAELKTNV